jgi:hypothetical protein
MFIKQAIVLARAYLDVGVLSYAANKPDKLSFVRSELKLARLQGRS